ncbi:IclR family transcriptional regulator [Nitriliruptoraceae bacterium ZYF776]|nr:IclR family transcriptional regulator [Profundirhabdus halotolerans]
MGASSKVPAATRTVALLRELGRQPRPVPASHLARALDLPRSTVYHLLAVLEREGFVVHLPEERRFGLGVAAFEIGSAYLRHEGLERLARPLLRELVDTVGGTAHLGVLDGRDTLYLVKEQAVRPAVLVTEVGVRLPAHLTASGRALLAGQSPAQLTALYPSRRDLADRTGRGPRTLAALRGVLDADRARGWSHEDGEVTDGVASVAAAARDHTGRALASVGLTARAAELGADLAAFAAAVRATADRLTGRLGGTPATS